MRLNKLTSEERADWRLAGYLLITVLVVLVLLAFLARPAHADTNLTMACASPIVSAGDRLSTCPQLVWTNPTAATLVASSTAEAPTWNGIDALWRLNGALPFDVRVIRCTADITPDVPFTAGQSGADPCPATAKPWVLVNFSAPTTFQVRVSWTAPTTGTQGTTAVPLAPGDILSYQLTWTPAAGGVGADISIPPAQSSYLLSLPLQRACVSLKAEGKEVWSDSTQPVCIEPKPRDPLKPDAPANVTVTFGEP